MQTDERNQVAQILQNYIGRTYSYQDPHREFYEDLVETWRKTGKSNSPDERDALNELVAEALG